MSGILDTALCYLAHGYCPIPIRIDGSKAPAIANWKPYQSCPPTEDQLRSWFGNGTLRGIGLVCGAVASNMEVLDFEGVAVEDGLFDDFLSLCADQTLKEAVESLVWVQTPTGGRHLIYRCAEPVASNQKLAARAEDVPAGTDGARKAGNGWVKVKTLIETRGEGGYIVAAGSPPQCHKEGQPYRLLYGHGELKNLPVLTGQTRQALLSIARALSEFADERTVVSPPKQSHDPHGLRPGDGYNQSTNWQELLSQYGWTRAGQRGDCTLWRRPGKEGPGISATTNHDNSDRLHVFSTNAYPLEASRAYDRFAFYTYMEHGGNFTEAAQELAGRGYGGQSLQATRTGGVSTCRARLDPAWPEPLDKDAFQGLAGEMVRTIEPHTESDPVAILAQFLVGFGSVIGRSAYYPVEADRHFSNLFVALVGASAKGRKGTSWGHVRNLMAAADPVWKEQRVKSGLSSGEGLIFNVRDAVEKEEPVRDTKTREITRYETVVADGGESDKRLLAVEPELATLLRVMERDGSTISARIRDAWDTGDLSTLTRSAPITATGAHISIIGHITKDELLRYLRSTETANGFANRFLWLCVRRSKLLPDGGNLAEVDLFPLLSQLRRAIEFARTAHEVRRDNTAREVWHAVYEKLSADTPGLLGAVTSRAEAQVTRLSLLYALLDCSARVREEHLMAALALWQYAHESARFIFGEALGDPVADTILKALRIAPNGLTRTEINALFKGHKDAGQLRCALDLLVAAGYARVEVEVTEGRSAERWFAL